MTHLRVWLLLLLLGEGAQGRCETRPWTEGLVDEDVLNFHCEGEQYFVCDDFDDIQDKLDHSRDWDEEICGLRVECTNTTSNDDLINIGFRRWYRRHSMLWIEVDSCGIGGVHGYFEDFGFYYGKVHLSFPNNEFNNLRDVDLAFFSPIADFSLNMSHNSLRKISDIDRDWYRTTRVLDFHSNKVDDIDDEAFGRVGNLRWLNMGNNQVSTVPQLGIQNNTAVTVLLNDNRISVIDTGAFNGDNLELLDLSGNLLTTVNAETFATVSRIETLLLSKNSITFVEQMAFAKTQVVNLDLSENLLQGVRPNVFAMLPQIRNLVLSKNKLAFIDRGAFENDVELRYLDLAHNDLETIPSGVFSSVPSLKTLLLSNNMIKAIESEPFTGLHIDFLSLSDNPLKTLDGVVFMNALVKNLDVSKCELTKFPHAAIRVLDTGLKAANLSANLIQDFPNAGLDVRFYMESLDLSSNRLDVIPCSWLADSLEYLYLNNNDISRIDNCPFTQRMLTITSFSLGSNPLNCCGLEWLRNIAAASGNLLDAQDTACAKPVERPFLGHASDVDDCQGTTAMTITGDSDSGTAGDFDEVDVIGAVVGTFVGTLVLLILAAVIFWLIKTKRVPDRIQKTSSPSTLKSKDRESDTAATPRHYSNMPRAATNKDVPTLPVYTGLVKPEEGEYELEIKDQQQPVYETVNDNV